MTLFKGNKFVKTALYDTFFSKNNIIKLYDTLCCLHPELE